MNYELMTDQWWLYVWNNYSISIGMVFVLLKILAILNPGVKTDKIMELLSQYTNRGKKE